MEHKLEGLAIGQTWEDRSDGPVMRVVAIDPELHSVEAEDPSGDVVHDTIEHFTATHRPAELRLAG